MATSRNTQFAVAVHVLAYLAGEGEGRIVSSEELARSINVNPVYVRRVLGPLRDAALVRSRPGKYGGWELASDATAVTLDRVWRLLQGGQPVLGLHGPNPACAVGSTVQESLIALDHSIACAIATRLQLITIHDVLTQSRSTWAEQRQNEGEVKASGPGPFAATAS